MQSEGESRRGVLVRREWRVLGEVEGAGVHALGEFVTTGDEGVGVDTPEDAVRVGKLLEARMAK